MPLLQRLPIELIPPIIETTMPEGFESFALTNKLIYTLARPFMKEYTARKKRFGDIRIWRFDFLAEFIHPMQLVSTVWQNPILGRYITKASFSTELMDESDDETTASQIDLEAAKQILRILFRRKWPIDGQWAEALAGQETGPASVLLLKLLPSLRYLNLSNILFSLDHLDCFMADGKLTFLSRLYNP